MPDHPTPGPSTGPSTHPASDQIDVSSWLGLDRLPRAMDEAADELDAVLSYASTWMCRPDGFAPSPVCVLRPLAEAMDVLGDAFTVLARRVADDWQDLRDGVVVATRTLRDSDAAAASSLPGA